LKTSEKCDDRVESSSTIGVPKIVSNCISIGVFGRSYLPVSSKNRGILKIKSFLERHSRTSYFIIHIYKHLSSREKNQHYRKAFPWKTFDESRYAICGTSVIKYYPE
jgi:hypothetical protein